MGDESSKITTNKQIEQTISGARMYSVPVMIASLLNESYTTTTIFLRKNLPRFCVVYASFSSENTYRVEIVVINEREK
jgi:hypothetical protein